MLSTALWGICRERLHSPGRESDDEAILNAVARKLAGMQLGNVHMMEPADLIERAPARLPHLVFYMCEEEDVLARLARWQQRGVLLVNPVEGVRNTLRTETVRILGGAPFFPVTRFVDTGAEPPPMDGRHWVKRADYHAVCADDVIGVDAPEALGRALERFRARGMARAVVQQHVEGDLIKFYGVREQGADTVSWFKWFYHENQVLAHHPVDERRLRETCLEGARRLGLEVFGGDVIVTPNGELFTIDFNAWPSFALYRNEAAGHIAAHIARRVAATAGEHAGTREATIATP